MRGHKASEFEAVWIWLSLFVVLFRLFTCLLLNRGAKVTGTSVADTGAAKAIGGKHPHRVAEVENGCSAIRPGVGPYRRPTHQVGRSFHDYREPGWSGQIEIEFARSSAKIEKLRSRVSFADYVEVKIR